MSIGISPSQRLNIDIIKEEYRPFLYNDRVTDLPCMNLILTFLEGYECLRKLDWLLCKEEKQAFQLIRTYISSPPSDLMDSTRDQNKVPLVQDHFMKKIKLKQKTIFNDSTTLILKYFRRPEFVRQFLVLYEELERDVNLESRTYLLNILFYSVLALKKFDSDNQNPSLQGRLTRDILNILRDDSSFHSELTEQYKLLVINSYFSTLTHKDYIAQCAPSAEESEEDRMLWSKNPFYLDIEEIMEDSFPSTNFGVVPIMKKLVDAFNSGSER